MVLAPFECSATTSGQLSPSLPSLSCQSPTSPMAWSWPRGVSSWARECHRRFGLNHSGFRFSLEERRAFRRVYARVKVRVDQIRGMKTVDQLCFDGGKLHDCDRLTGVHTFHGVHGLIKHAWRKFSRNVNRSIAILIKSSHETIQKGFVHHCVWLSHRSWHILPPKAIVKLLCYYKRG